MSEKKLHGQCEHVNQIGTTQYYCIEDKGHSGAHVYGDDSKSVREILTAENETLRVRIAQLESEAQAARNERDEAIAECRKRKGIEQDAAHYREEIEEAKEILWKEIDRNRGNETLAQLCVIAANGVYWRQRNVETVRAQRDASRQSRRRLVGLVRAKRRKGTISDGERLARVACVLGTQNDYGMIEPILLQWLHALKEIASKLPSKQLQEQLLSSTAKANERLAKKLRWELSQIAADALAAPTQGTEGKDA